ncbi:MAG: phosphate ABC transporter permease PstA [Methanosarcinales archaeon Met12]|nr:MAG: phosphate ABC transporter permease PstA [Methanosarcinales archaeon Met12]
MNYRKLEERICIMISWAAAAVALLALTIILGTITWEALPSLSIYFMVTPESDVPGLGGGVANAIAGTFLLAVLSTAFAAPLALGTAIYLKRYTKSGAFVNAMNFLLDVLAGTPSIVLGVFGLFFLVFYMKHITGGFSLFAATIALVLVVLPVIERATETAIDSVPAEIEEGSYALGATKWETLRHITIPYASVGMITGVILGIGRAVEQSAVVLLTAGYTQFLPEFKILPSEVLIFGIEIRPLQDLVAALPITVFRSFSQPHLTPASDGFGAAFALVLIMILLNATIRILIRWRGQVG